MSKPNFIQKTMRMYRMTLFFVAVLVFGGIFSLYQMPKEEFPEMNIPLAMLVAVYPGASPEQIELEVGTPLDDFLDNFQDLNRKGFSTVMSDGMYMSLMQANPDCPDAKKLWSEMRHSIPLFKQTKLPPGVLGLVLIDDFASVPTMLISIESNDKSYRELQDYIEQLRIHLRDVDNINDLHILGSVNEQISIYLDKERLVRYGLSRTIVKSKLTLDGYTLGGSHASDHNVSMPIYVTNTFQSDRELADQIIYSDPLGHVVRLRDVARVVREYPDKKSYIANNGNRCLLLSIQMSQGQNISFFGRDVEKVVREFRATLPPSVHLNYIVDQPSVVNTAVLNFLRDLLLAIIIVVLIMMILFPTRSAIVAGISIPFTMTVTLLIMYGLGISLNTATLAALIVVLGMIVDDSIVIIDAHQNELIQKHSSWYASVMSVWNLLPSITMATLSICVVFLPITIFAPAMIGGLTNGFIYTIIISLLVSLFTATIFVPLLNHWMLGRSSSQGTSFKESRLLKPVEAGYDRLLTLCFRFPKSTIALGLGIIVAGVLIFKSITLSMLPMADRNQFVVEVHTPTASSIDKTNTITDSVAAIIKRDPRVVNVTEFIGQIMPRFMVTAPVAMGSNHFSQMIVTTESNEATIELLDKFTGYFDERWPDTYVRMVQLSYSPMGGMRFDLLGTDLTLLHQAADTLQAYMHQNPNLMWIHDSSFGRSPALSVDLDPVVAAQMGMTRIGTSLDVAVKFGGFKVGDLWEGNYQMPVYLYAADREQAHDIGSLEDEYISTLTGSVPLRQAAQVRPEWHETAITHQNGMRSLSIYADVKRGASQAAEVKKIKRYVESHPEILPPGVKFSIQGTSRINKLIGGPMAKSLIVSIVIILFIMVLNFQRFKLAFVALSGVAFAIPGAAIGQWLSGFDLGITSMLGFCSLLGIVMRNVIIMFDYVQELSDQGMSVREAAFLAGKRRMTPIFLTAATTAVGVVPVMYSPSTLWPPMGWIIFFGTFFATFLIVTVMPCAYWLLMDNKSKK